MNMLIYTDGASSVPKNSIGNIACVDDIKFTDSFPEVKRLLSKEVNGFIPYSVLVINTLFFDTKLEESQLEEISESFQGAIIVKVPDDVVGLDLIKRHMITDYYTAGGDETAKLQSVVSHAMIHNRCLDRQLKMQEKFNILEVIEKTVVNKK